MDSEASDRRFHFEEKTSAIVRILELPIERRGAGHFKNTLRKFLALLGALARRRWP